MNPTTCSAGASSTTTLVGVDPQGAPGAQVRLGYSASAGNCTPMVYQTNTYLTGNLNYSMTPGGQACNSTNVMACVQNNDTAWKAYAWFLNGTRVNSGAIDLILRNRGDALGRDYGCSVRTLAPCESTNGYAFYELAYDPVTGASDKFGQPIPITAEKTTSALTTNNYSPGQYQSGFIDPATNSPILFSATNDVSAITQGINALYDETRRAHIDSVKSAFEANAYAASEKASLTTLNTTASSMDSKLGTVNTKLDTLNTSVGGVTTELRTGLLTNLNGFNAQNTAVTNKLEQIRSIDTNLYSAFLTTTNNIQQTANRLDNVQTKLDTANATLSTISGNIGTSRDYLSTVAAKTTDTANNTWRSYVAEELMTNQLGQVYSVLKGETNLLSYATNLFAVGTNQWAVMTNLQAGANGLLQGVTNGMNTATNLLGQIATNEQANGAWLSLIAGHTSRLTNGFSLNDSGITNAINGEKGELAQFHQDNTNLLGRIASVIATNRADPDASSYATVTNIIGADASGHSAGDAAAGQVDGYISGIGTAPGGGGGGDASGFVIAFAGTTLDLNPNTIAPGAMGYVKTLVTLVATVFFCISMSRSFFELTQTYASAQSGGMPNMEVLGTNAAGAIAGPIIAGALIAVWCAVFTAFFGLVGTQILAMSGLSYPTNPSTLAVYMLNETFPVSLLLTFAWTRVAAYLLMGKLVIIAGSISRFLFGS